MGQGFCLSLQKERYTVVRVVRIRGCSECHVPAMGGSMGRLIKQGSKGADVRAIQDVLNFHIRRLTAL